MEKSLEQQIDKLVTTAAKNLQFYFTWGELENFHAANDIMSKFDYNEEPCDYTKKALKEVQENGQPLEPFIIVKHMMSMGLGTKPEFEREVAVTKDKLKLLYDTSKFKEE